MKNNWLWILTLLLLIVWLYNPSIPFAIVFIPIWLVFLPLILIIGLVAIIVSLIGIWLVVLFGVVIVMLIIEWIKSKL